MRALHSRLQANYSESRRAPVEAAIRRLGRGGRVWATLLAACGGTECSRAVACTNARAAGTTRPHGVTILALGLEEGRARLSASKPLRAWCYSPPLPFQGVARRRGTMAMVTLPRFQRRGAPTHPPIQLDALEAGGAVACGTRAATSTARLGAARATLVGCYRPQPSFRFQSRRGCRRMLTRPSTAKMFPSGKAAHRARGLTVS